MQKNKPNIKASYLAGFLDGDGSIYVRAKPNSTYKYGFQIAPYIVFYQSKKEETNFRKIFSNLKYGYMRERKDGILEYTIGRKEDIISLIYFIKPYLILKIRQANLIIEILKKKEKVKNIDDFKKLLELVDNFRNLNYSKKRKKHKLTP
jgi:hypothetical protein